MLLFVRACEYTTILPIEKPSISDWVLSRRHTPLSGINIERTTTYDKVIDGVPIPKGTDVSVSPIETSHNTNIYGADAADFRPERWVDATEQQWREMDRASMVFSYGPRICIGRHLAGIEMRKAIAAIIMTFKVSDGRILP